MQLVLNNYVLSLSSRLCGPRYVYVVYIGGTYSHIGEELIFLGGIEANH